MARFDSNVAIRIGADFVGLPAFKKADTSVDKLYKSTKKLAAAFGVTFSAAAIGRFAANSIRAFAAEERQIAQLTQTVTNLGLAFQASEANAFIEDLERMTGIAREELQPAFQKLITQTGSIVKSQKILQKALDVSMSGLMSVEEAAGILTQAYVGNVKGLKSLNLGFTAAELKAMSFEEILYQIGKTYKDTTKAALEGTEAKLKKIRIAAGNAQESIGGGLVDAFADLAGDGGNLDKANSKLERFGEILGGLFANAFNPVKIGEFYLPIPNLAAAFKQPMASVGNPAEWRRNNAKIIAAEKKAQEDALKREKARLDLLRKQSTEKRAQAALDKANKALSAANAMFDPQGIQIAAALQGNITAEQRARLELMQKIWELEQAISQGNTELIEKLTAQLLELTKQTAQLNANFKALERINDLMNSIGYGRQLFDIGNIERTLELLKRIGGGTYTPSSFVNTFPEDVWKGILFDLPNAAAEDVVVPEVIVNIDGNLNGLIDVVVDGLQNKSASGVDTRILRNTGGFNW
jgi:hypothetical protein